MRLRGLGFRFSSHYALPCARLLVLVGAYLTLAAPLWCQEGAVSGTVADAETLLGIPGAHVYLPEGAQGTVTDAQGRYRIEGVPAGTTTVTVRLIGYAAEGQTTEIVAGQTTSVAFEIQQTALRLQELVVTGLVGATPRVKLPFTVERIDSEAFPVPSSDLSSLLVGKAPGVTITRTTGQPGQESSIILRGPTSINNVGRSQGPLIVIDGVIQAETATLSDISTRDIDHVEIVKGAAAASLYGSRAQAGVIQITTKRGTDLTINTSNLLMRGEYGVSQLLGSVDFQRNHEFVMNPSGTKFIDEHGNEVDYGDLNRNGNGQPVVDGESGATTFRDGEFPDQRFDNLERFFDPGRTWTGYAAISGHFAESGYRVSADRYRETGIVDCGEPCRNPIALENFGQDYAVRDDGFDRINTRMNVDSRLGDLDVAASGFYSSSAQDNVATTVGAFQSLLFANPGIDYTQPDEDGLPLVDVDPFTIFGNPLYFMSLVESERRRSRKMASINMSLPALRGVRVEANLSYDRTDLSRSEFTPKRTQAFGQFAGGALEEASVVDEAVNASATASLTGSYFDGDLIARGKLRVSVENQDFGSRGVFGRQFTVEDVPNFAALVGELSAENESREVRSLGYFGILGLDYKGKYIVDGLVRRDGSSLFGPAQRWHTYYRGSAAWRISQEDFWHSDWLDEFKLRASIGSAGGRPNFAAQYETYLVQAGAIFPSELGNVELRPEISVERELGVNLVLFEDFAVDGTYAWATTDDQLLLVPQPAYAGFSAQWQNAGEIRSNTWELSLGWSAVDRADVGLQFRANWNRTRAVISRFDIPEYTQAGFRHAEGEPIGSLWGRRIAEGCADVARSVGLMSGDGFDCSGFQVNDEGYMVFVGEGNEWTDGIENNLWGTTGEVTWTAEGETQAKAFDWGMPFTTQEQSRSCLRRNPTDRGRGERCPLQELLPVGGTQPDWSAGFATDFRYKGLTVNALLDATVGFDLFNGNRRNQFNWDSSPEQDQADKPESFRKPLDYYNTLQVVGGLQRRFLEPGGWLKLREVAIGFSLPESIVSGLFGGAIDRITLHAIGRNLITWTDFEGFDPEAGFEGSSVGSATIDRWVSFQYPNSRIISASVEIVF